MAPELITDTEALKRTFVSLGLPPDGGTDALVAASLRRAGAMLAPCRAWELTRAVWTSLEPLAQVAVLSAEKVDAVLEELLSIGDFAEVIFGTEKDSGIDEVLLCLTPPAFVRLDGGRIVLLGGSDEGPTALPQAMLARVVHRGAVREVEPRPEEDMADMLGDFGLIEITADAWLKLPRKESATGHIKSVVDRMPAASAPRVVDGLTVLGPGRVYSRRWCEPEKEAGLFVARRPQLYGAALWCAARMREGQILSLLDLHAPGARWRPCDLAWQLQYALDAERAAPQLFRRRESGQRREIIEVDFPLPSWTERRLRLVGERITSSSALLAFEVPASAASAECQFLQDYLWMREERI